MPELARQDFSEQTKGQTAVGVIAPTTQAADAGGDEFTNDGRTHLWVKNTSGGPVTVTAAVEGNCTHGVAHALAITVNDGDEGPVGPFRFDRFSESSRTVALTYSSTPAGFEVGAVRF